MISPNDQRIELLETEKLRKAGIRKGRVKMRWFGLHDSALAEFWRGLNRAQAVARDQWEAAYGRDAIVVDVTLVRVDDDGGGRSTWQMMMTFISLRADADATTKERVEQIVEAFKTRRIQVSD